MQVAGNTNGKVGRWQKAMGAVAAVGTVVALVYYVLALSDRVTGHDHGGVHEEFVRISALSETDAPWIGKRWVGEADSNVTFDIDTGGLFPVAVVSGMGLGKVKWVPSEVSDSGLTFRGKAVCMEHGGIIGECATLHLEPNNTLLFKLANKKIVLVPRSITSSVATARRIK